VLKTIMKRKYDLVIALGFDSLDFAKEIVQTITQAAKPQIVVANMRGLKMYFDSQPTQPAGRATKQALVVSQQSLSGIIVGRVLGWLTTNQIKYRFYSPTMERIP